jgi:hypothetical protein
MSTTSDSTYSRVQKTGRRGRARGGNNSTNTTTTTTTTTNNKTPKTNNNNRGGSSRSGDRNSAIAVKQKNTGLHIDSNAFNLWETQVNHNTYKPLDRFRPFQSFIALTDSSSNQRKQDGGLEVVPGFHQIMENYFQHHEAGYRGRLLHVSPYNMKFDEDIDDWIYPEIQKVQRIPADWQPSNEVNNTISISKGSGGRTEQYIAHCQKISREHKALKYEPVKAGDFVFWDIRLAHQNSEKNATDVIRSVFYHAYLLAQPDYINKNKIAEYKKIRRTRDHSSDFNKKWTNIEKTGFEPKELDTTLSQLLYDEKEWKDDLLQDDGEIGKILKKHNGLITERHIAFYKRYGYVTIENAVDSELCQALYDQALQQSKLLGCDIRKGVTAEEWKKIGGNFGAMVEYFWLPQQEIMRHSEELYTITVDLYQQTWGSQDPLFANPLKDADGRKLWVYNDRMNIRLPDSWTK